MGLHEFQDFHHQLKTAAGMEEFVIICQILAQTRICCFFQTAGAAGFRGGDCRHLCWGHPLLWWPSTNGQIMFFPPKNKAISSPALNVENVL